MTITSARESGLPGDATRRPPVSRIDAIGIALPSRIVTNEHLLDLVRRHNADVPEEQVRRNDAIIRRIVKSAGVESRQFRDVEAGETVISLTQKAVRDALSRAGREVGEVDLLIHAGVARGFLEPASAYHVARACGLSAHCFDISDACMGWLRACHVAFSLIRSGEYRCALIVNPECAIYEHGFPELLRISPQYDLRHTFPAFTIGEAVTATVLSGADDPWTIKFASHPELVERCSIPIKGFEQHALRPELCALNGEGMFYSEGRELVAEGTRLLGDLIKSAVPNRAAVHRWFPHVASLDAAVASARDLGVDLERVHLSTFRKHGNCVSASIPLAMAQAERARLIGRGDSVGVCAASAGLACGVALFNF